ncbi:PilZ domain-containing protein [Thiocystis violascens DSM 198]|uniref:PilZ domain-containing protein n=2 Tax=Thiocystis violascens TaxID=73141 RepID=I3Y6V2_THIV6|nr:PilZ domain-containing protein [Thiocystis violascens DSM 198]
MTIEPTQHTPHPIELQVHIHYGKRRFFCARGRDLSQRGMYLEVRNLTLPTGTQVNLEFHGFDQDGRIEATVVHRDSAGIQVLFATPQPELLPGLEQISVPPPTALVALPECALAISNPKTSPTALGAV